MPVLNRLASIFVAVALLGSLPVSLEARTKKGDRLLREGGEAYLAENWDGALELYEQALAEDPTDPQYQMAVRRTRFWAGQDHVKKGQELVKQGKLEEALQEFQRAYAIDPASSIAEQEVVRTYRLIRQREQEGEEGAAPPEAGEGLSPEAQAAMEREERLARLNAVPELKPISPRLNTLRMNNQPVTVLYETVCKLAGINVVIDSEFQNPSQSYDVDLTNATLDQALNHLAVLTRTYWKPLTENTIFVTNDNVTKRRDYEEQVVKVAYLKNITKVQDLQEIVAAVRAVTNMQRVYTYNAQNAILFRGTKDQVDLAEKLIFDLDKPLAEVVVDVIVMQARRGSTRDLAANIMSGGINGLSLPIGFTGGAVSAADDGGTGSSGGVRLSRLGGLSTNDWSVTMPGAFLEALMTGTDSRVLQRPQVRVADGQQATLNLGLRIPYATGSYQPGIGTAVGGISPLVSTQFQFYDVGVNVTLTPKVHGEDEVSLHLELDVSNQEGTVDLGGLEQPVIGQRKITEDIRVKSGEVTLVGGLTVDDRSRKKSGVPGLANIPILKWFGFTSEGKMTDENEMLIALVPHIVRRPEITELNTRGISSGTEQVIKLSYAPNNGDYVEPEAPQGAAAEPAAAETVTPPATGQPATEPAAPEPAAAEPEAPASGPASLRFNPPAVSTKQGATFTVALEIDNATDLFNAPVRFQFDPQRLQLDELQRGAFLSQDGQQVIFTRNILNNSGDASVVLNRMPGSQGMSGSGALLTLTFRVIGGTGPTEVRIPDPTIRDSGMVQIPVTPPSLAVQIE